MTHLEGWSAPALRAFILETAMQYPGVFHKLCDMADLASGREGSLVEGIRQDLEVIAGGPWEEEDCVEAIDRLGGRLGALVERGRADEVVGLGMEILRAGNRFEGTSQDEWTAEHALMESMEQVFDALGECSLPEADRLVLAVDLDIEDEYGLCSDGAERFLVREEHSREAWSEAADALLARLKETEHEEAYRRNKRVEWAAQALEGAGRSDEIVPLWEREAEERGSYEELVRRLIALERYEEAKACAWRGIERMEGGDVNSGSSSRLRDLLRRAYEALGEWAVAASLRAERFFLHPSEDSYDELREAAENAGVWPAVREAALGYLETGELPWDREHWPLEKTRGFQCWRRRSIGPFPCEGPSWRSPFWRTGLRMRFSSTIASSRREEASPEAV